MIYQYNYLLPLMDIYHSFQRLSLDFRNNICLSQYNCQYLYCKCGLNSKPRMSSPLKISNRDESDYLKEKISLATENPYPGIFYAVLQYVNELSLKGLTFNKIHDLDKLNMYYSMIFLKFSHFENASDCELLTVFGIPQISETVSLTL